MLNHVRMATEEETRRIASTSDLSGEYTVLALDNKAGDADISVFRRVFELDPTHFAESSSVIQRAKFIYALEERMMGAGVREYYFNVKADDVHWQEILKSWGMIPVSPQPDIRFKRILIEEKNGNENM